MLRLEFLDHRIIRLLRVQRIGDRAFDRLVVFGKRPVRERGERREDAAHALRIHDERPHVIRRVRIGFEVGNVIADPLLLRLVPPDLSAVGIPGLAGRIARGAVVHHAAIRRPRPRPVRINAEAGRIVRAAALHLRAGFGPRTAE